MRKAFGETGGVKVYQAVLSLSKMSKAIKEYILYIYSALHIFLYGKKKQKTKKSSRKILSVVCKLSLCPCPFIPVMQSFFL